MLAPNQEAKVGLEYDFYSTFLTRNWIGGGAFSKGEKSGFYLEAVNEIKLGRLFAINKFTYTLGQKIWERQHTIGYKLAPQLSAFWQIGQGIGLRFIW